MPVPRKAPVVEKAKFPLVWKLFGLTALLIAIVVTVAVAITIQRANAIAKTTVDNSIAGAAKLFKEFERQRLGRLALGAELVGHDPSFFAYIEHAMTAPNDAAPIPVAPGQPAAVPPPTHIDFPDILDQISTKKELLNSDLVMLLDLDGKILARTDQPAISGTPTEELSSPLAKKIVDDATLSAVSGVIKVDNHLYHAAIAPLVLGANNVRRAYVVNAYAIDDAFANRIEDSTNAGVLFASPDCSIVRSHGAPMYGMQSMSDVRHIFSTGKALPPTTAQIEQTKYVMDGEPLQSAGEPLGAAVFIRSLDRELAPFREIQNALLVGGGIALLRAFIFSWLIAH